MRVFPHMDGDKLIELVEKREYDLLALALHDAHNRLEQQIQDTVKRMESVPLAALLSLYHDSFTTSRGIEAVRTRLIQAAKGEQQ